MTAFVKVEDILFSCSRDVHTEQCMNHSADQSIVAIPSPVFLFSRQSSHTPLLEEELIFILLLGGKNRQNGRALAQKPLAGPDIGAFSFLICALHT